MQYKKRYTFNKINQDLAPDKRDSNTHYNIVNFETFLTSRSASMKLSKGTENVTSTELHVELLTSYVIGDVTVGRDLYVWITDNFGGTPTVGSNDAVYKLTITKTTVEVLLITQGSWKLSTLFPIQAVGIDETVTLRKLYWVDSFNQARYLHIKKTSAAPYFKVNTEIDFVRPNPLPGTIIATPYGSLGFKDAKVRYAYTTYDVNETESRLSPLSEAVNIGPDIGSAQIQLQVPTSAYQNYRVYRIMWETYLDAPTYALIKEGSIPATGEVVFVDNGTLFITGISNDEFVDLGSDYIIPGSITAKKQRLFLGNYKKGAYIITSDLRAFQHTDAGAVDLIDQGVPTNYPNGWQTPIPRGQDAINGNLATNLYQGDGVTLGAEGDITKLWLNEVDPDVAPEQPIFRSGEIYRIGIVGQDTFGRDSHAYWVCDIKIPAMTSNAGALRHHSLGGILKIQPEGMASYRFVYVKRDQEDKTVLSQGVVQPLMDFYVGPDTVTGDFQGTFPFPNMKEVNAKGKDLLVGGVVPLADNRYFDIRLPYCSKADIQPPQGSPISPGPNQNIGRDFYSSITDLGVHENNKAAIYTPDTLLYRHNIPGSHVKKIGVQEITQSASRIGWWDPSETFAEEQPYNFITFNMRNWLNHPGGSWGPPQDMFGGDTVDTETDHYSMEMVSRSSSLFYPADDQDTHDIEYAKYIGIGATDTLGDTALSNTANITHFAKNGSVMNWQAECLDFYGINVQSAGVDDPLWTTDGVSDMPYSGFIPAGWADGNLEKRGFPIVDVLQVVPSQYGGQTLDAKSLNFYIDCSRGTSSFGSGIQIPFHGDTYVGQYAIPKLTGATNFGHGRSAAVYDYDYVYLEAEIAIFAANKAVQDIPKNLQFGQNTAKFVEVKNLVSNIDVFSQPWNQSLYGAINFNTTIVDQFTTRITPSTVKIAGETVDSWTQINTDTYLDLESMFGPIINLSRVGDSVIAFQHKAIAGISILPDTQTTTKTGTINLGKGTVLDDYKYITIENGTENFQCIEVVGDDVYFIDTINRILMSIKNGEISPIKGFNSTVLESSNDGLAKYLVNDDSGGFVSYNEDLKQVMFKFSPDFPVLNYNPLTKEFVNCRTYDGYYFITNNNNSLSADKATSKLWLHDRGTPGMYYGAAKKASITMLVEPIPGMDKVFDAITLLKRGASNFETIQIDSPTRTSGLVSTSWKSKFDIHTTHLPRVSGSNNRFRERNLFIKLEYASSSDLEVDEIFVKFSAKKM